MLYVKSEFVVEDIIKKSCFIGVLMPCVDERVSLQTVKQVQHKYADARHIAYAYRIN